MIFEDNIIKYDLDPVDKGLAETCFECMKTHKNNVAQYVSDTNEEDTYRSLLQRSIRCALKMKSKGLKEGDVISVCSYNHKNTCVPFFGAIFLGIKFAPLVPISSAAETVHLIKEVAPKTIFVSMDGLDLIEKSISLAKPSYKINIVVFGNSSQHEEFDEYLVPNEKEEDFRPVPTKSLDDTAIILFSSGTTGLAKGICLRNRACTSRAFEASRVFGDNKKQQEFKDHSNNNTIPQVILCYSNIFWVSQVGLLIFTALLGFSRVIAREFNAAEFWRLIQKYKVSTTWLTPYQAMALCKEGKPEGINTDSIRLSITAGATIPISVLYELRKLLPTAMVTQFYGQTEVFGSITSFNPNSDKDRELSEKNTGSVGRPTPGYWYKVADIETGKPLGPNQQGELCVKTDNRMNGYFNRDSTDVFDNEGYLKTGDIVYYDEDFCFYIVDRLKHFFKYRSSQIAPAFIEGIIKEHPAVQQAVVIGVPHEEDGEHPLAIVQLNDGSENVTAEEIIKFVDERVDDTKKLRAGVRFVKEFPLTATDKIKKLDLRRMFKEMVL